MTTYSIDPKYISPKKEAKQEEGVEADRKLALSLRALVTELNEKDRSFATSLLKWIFNDGRSWTAKQKYWAGMLEAQARAKREIREKTKATIVPKKFPNIAKLFLSNPNIANLAWPKISYKLSENGPIIELCYNKNYNCIQARLPGKKLIGTIRLPNGVEDIRWPIKDEHFSYLAQIEADPIAAAKLSGKLTSCCSFCSRELTDELSVKAGYGPICAEHWGLPWGGKRSGVTTIEMEL